VIHLERPSFFRERFANMYPLWAYSLSWLLVELPYVLLESLLFGSILYWSCNFNPELWRFAWCVFVSVSLCRV
jgi:ABC-type multidrug transport system permease subunit